MRPSTTTISRRTATKGLAATLGLAGTGLGALALGTDDAQAAITTAFTVPEVTYADEQPPHDIFLQAAGQWEYSGLDTEPNDPVITLRVGASADNFDRLATFTKYPFGFDSEGTYTLQGSLADTAIWSSDEFAPGDGQTVTHTVYGEVELEVKRDDEVLASASASDSGTVTIEDTSATWDAAINGDGQFAYQQNETDATPTPP